MILRHAQHSDLPQLKAVYAGIVEAMEHSGVFLWNESYPYAAFLEDIEKSRLWLLCDNEQIAAAFALKEFTDSGDIIWQQPDSPALTLMRLGVNPAYRSQGIGVKCIESAKAIARERGCKFLRLFVVDCNTPAERFYLKCGFVRGGGKHIENRPDHPTVELTEYGYEIGV